MSSFLVICGYNFLQSIEFPPLSIKKSLEEEILFSELKSFLSINSVKENLDFVKGFNLRRKRKFGIQQDLSIRGGSYEDNKVFINGTRINDPQTGCFNLKMPFTEQDLRFLKIFENKNPINFILKKPQGKGGIIKFKFGEHVLFSKLLSLNFSFMKSKNKISFEHKTSSGNRKDADFDIYNFVFYSLKKFDNFEIEFCYAYSRKKFGANSFYSSLFPFEAENTNQKFSFARTKLEGKNKIEFAGYYKRHTDDFVLKRENPSFYRNHHKRWGFIPRIKFKKINLCVENEWRKEKINNQRLGKAQRFEESVGIKFLPRNVGNFFWDFEFKESYLSSHKFLENFSTNFGHECFSDLKVKFNIPKDFRMPSFAELSGFSSVNLGSSDSKVCQKNLNFEEALEAKFKDLDFEITFFTKTQKNVIDWVRQTSASRWGIQNIGDLNPRGIEVSLSYNSLTLTYSFLDLNKENPFRFSKYIFRYLKHHLTLNYKFPFKIIEMFINLDFKNVYKFRFQEKK